MATRDTWDQRRQRAIEGLYEDERLRSNLTDAAAGTLLRWAEAQVEAAVQTAARVADPESARMSLDDALRRLRAVVREINDLVGEKDALSAAQLRDRMVALLSPPGRLPPALARSVDELVAPRGRLSDADFVVRLTELVSQAGPGKTGGRDNGEKG